MLGSLSRWLRLFGFDTIYSNKFNDLDLIKTSIQEGRILLTKDKELSKSKILREVLFIESENLEDQLREVFVYLKDKNFEITNLSLRCPVCNGEIGYIPKEEIIYEIPDYLAVTIEEFYRCSVCKKIYWQGSHKDKIDKRREEILRSILNP